jgi:hypothetical protein
VATQIDMNLPTSAVAHGMAIQSSSLLPSLFRSLNEGRRLTILDVGAALPETVEFFSRFKCRIHFVDLFSELALIELQQVSSSEDLVHHFDNLLKLPKGTSLDICLFWDFLYYLDKPALRAFNSCLRPYMYHGTRAHGFGAHNLAARVENQQYGVIEEDAISVRQRQTKQLPFHLHSQPEMQEIFSSFDFERGLLLADGKLELLLKTRGDILGF